MKRIFFGWWVVLASLVLGAFSVGVGYFTVPVFYPSLMAEFGWSRTQVVAGGSIALTLYGLLSPLSGLASDTLGAKRTKLIGIIILGLALSLFPLVSGLALYFMISLLLGMGMSGIDGAPTQVLVSKWFYKYEGLAMGIVVGGVGLGGVFGPLAASYLIENFSWRTALGALAVVLWLLVLPLFVLLVKESPSELGLGRDGERHPTQNGPLEPATGGKGVDLAGLGFSQALGTDTFWMLNLGTFCLLFAIFALTQNWILYLQQDLGLSLQKASRSLSVIFLSSIPGKVVMGFLADRISRKWILVVCCWCVSLSLFMLRFIPTSDWVLYASSSLLGLSYGCVFVILPLMARTYFGLHSLGKILGVVFFTLSIGGALGPLVVGQIRDLTGTYQTGFSVLFVTSLISVVVFSYLKRPDQTHALQGLDG